MKSLISCLLLGFALNAATVSAQAWLTPTDDPKLRACQQSAFSIKVGLDERGAGLSEQQAVDKWTKIVMGRGGGIYELRLMVGGIRNAYKVKNPDYSLVERIYYHCVENIE